MPQKLKCCCARCRGWQVFDCGDVPASLRKPFWHIAGQLVPPDSLCHMFQNSWGFSRVNDSRDECLPSTLLAQQIPALFPFPRILLSNSSN